MAGPNNLNFGYGYRQGQQTPQQTGASLPPGTGVQNAGGSAPGVEALRQAVIAQQQDNRGYDIRSSIRMPTENKNLVSAGYDIWRSNSADRKSREASVASAEATASDQQQKEAAASTKQEQQRFAEADAVYEFVIANGGKPEQAKAAAQAVYAGAKIDLSDFMQKDKAPTGKEADYNFLSEMVGPDKAKELIMAGYAKEPEKPTGTQAEYQALAEIYGEEQAKLMLGTKYKAEGEGGSELKDVSKLPSEGRIKLGLIRQAAELTQKALPVMFEGDQFRNTKSALPANEVSRAQGDMREALTVMLRAVSGAAIPETEIQREVDGMMPGVTDGDKNAKAKVERAVGKINNLFNMLSAGYDMPEELSLPRIGMPWSDMAESSSQESQTIDGKTYIKVDGEWFEQ